MKKLLLASMLGLFSLAASANNKIAVVNNLPGCKGVTMTVQFFSYMETTCVPDISSIIYPVPGTYDLDDPATWLPGTLAMPSYETFSAVVCIYCPGMQQPFCLPAVGIDMVPGRACNQPATPSLPVLGSCCTQTISANVVGGNGGGTCFTLSINP